MQQKELKDKRLRSDQRKRILCRTAARVFAAQCVRFGLKSELGQNSLFDRAK